MTAKISVIIPSRLQPNPSSTSGNLYLDNALLSVQAQQQIDMDEIEVVVGLDKGTLERVPARFLKPPPPGWPRLRFVESAGEGQARAVNAAVEDATGTILAFLEDDDLWTQERLCRAVEALDQGYSFVSSSQREVADDDHRSFVRYNDFPTPSGWVMPRATWDKVGPLDESFRWHVDTEWLGRAGRAGIKRVHQVDPGGRDRLNSVGSWLANVRRHSAVAVMAAPEPYVTRVRNAGGGMMTIAASPMARAQSIREHEIMAERYGGIPW